MSRAARSVAGVALAIGIMAVAACEPSGPGALTATVQAPVPTGAVVVELAGARISRFEGVGDTRTFAADPTAADTVQRVVVLSPGGGGILRFRLHVDDVGAEPPRGAVVEAVDLANQQIPSVTDYRITISR